MTRRNTTGMILRRDHAEIALKLRGEMATAVLKQRAVGGRRESRMRVCVPGERVVAAIRNSAVRSDMTHPRPAGLAMLMPRCPSPVLPSITGIGGDGW